jgi:hypothetical protein
MTWYNTFDAVFFITITTIIAGSFGLVVKFCLKSKCEEVDCFYGFLKFNRRVELEVQEELVAMNNRVRANTNTPTKPDDLTLDIP